MYDKRNHPQPPPSFHRAPVTKRFPCTAESNTIRARKSRRSEPARNVCTWEHPFRHRHRKVEQNVGVSVEIKGFGAPLDHGGRLGTDPGDGHLAITAVHTKAHDAGRPWTSSTTVASSKLVPYVTSRSDASFV